MIPGKTNHQYQFSGKEMAWGNWIREGGNDIGNGILRMERTQPIWSETLVRFPTDLLDWRQMSARTEIYIEFKKKWMNSRTDMYWFPPPLCARHSCHLPRDSLLVVLLLPILVFTCSIWYSFCQFQKNFKKRHFRPHIAAQLVIWEDS